MTISPQDSLTPHTVVLHYIWNWIILCAHCFFSMAMTLTLDVKVMCSAYLLKKCLPSEQWNGILWYFFGWTFSVVEILHLSDQIKWLNLNFVVLQNLIHQPLTFIYFKICFVTGINKETRFFSNYLYSLQFWQQRKYSTDVIMCSTKAILLLKKHCTFSSSCFHELKSIRHTIFPFHLLLRFNISYFKHNGIHTPSKPVQQESSSMHSTLFVFQISILGSAVCPGIYSKTWPWYGGVAPQCRKTQDD